MCVPYAQEPEAKPGGPGLMLWKDKILQRELGKSRVEAGNFLGGIRSPRVRRRPR